jgi:hypothetical protein
MGSDEGPHSIALRRLRGVRATSGAQRIKREKIKPGDRVSVEAKLDLYLKPEAVNVRLLGPEKQ